MCQRAAHSAASSGLNSLDITAGAFGSSWRRWVPESQLLEALVDMCQHLGEMTGSVGHGALIHCTCSTLKRCEACPLPQNHNIRIFSCQNYGGPMLRLPPQPIHCLEPSGNTPPKCSWSMICWRPSAFIWNQTTGLSADVWRKCPFEASDFGVGASALSRNERRTLA
jgi:hypothetical protein